MEISKLLNQEEIKTIWYLSTLGNKLHTRINKGSILNVCIPNITKLIDSSINLRLSSNLMYGLSVLYKLKVNFVLNELQDMKNQIRRNTLETNEKLLVNTAILNSFLKDDPSFVIEDLVPEFELDQEIEFGRNFQLIGFDHNSLSEISMNFEVPNLENEEYDLDLSLSDKSTVNLDLSSDFQFGELGPSPSPMPSPKSPFPLPNPPNLGVKRKRKHSLIIDTTLQMPTSIYLNFKKNYPLIMQIEKFKKRTPDRPIELGRRLTIVEEPNEISEFDINVDTLSTIDQGFEISLPDIDISDFRSSSRSSMSRPINIEVEAKNQENEKFLNYLKNFNSEKIQFSDMCPLRCNRNIAAKSFLNVLELASKGEISIGVDRDFTEFGTATEDSHTDNQIDKQIDLYTQQTELNTGQTELNTRKPELHTEMHRENQTPVQTNLLQNNQIYVVLQTC